MKSKFISVVTALAIIVLLMPATFAAETTEPLFNNWTEAAKAAVQGTDYTQNNASYTIKTAKGLAWFANAVNKGLKSIDVKLTNDIDLSDVVNDSVLTEENNWIPIGNYGTTAFIGQFDGQGHTISGMKIKSNQLYQGLFGCVNKDSTIKNIKIDKAQINLMEIDYTNADAFPDGYCGGIAGYNEGVITGCETDLEMVGCMAGGIVGYNTGTVEYCKNAGKISGMSDIGGIAGHNYGAIKDCENAGNMTGVFCIGGIAGNVSTSAISECSNSGVITGQLWTGGIAGLISNNSTIVDCKNTGNIIEHCPAFDYLPSCGEIGGIAGRIDSSNSEVKRCYNSGDVTSDIKDAEQVGGIAGMIYREGVISDCVNDGNISSADWDAGGIVGDISVIETENNPIVINCVNNGNVHAVSYAGGIAGSSTYKIENCYNTGNISANLDAGGIVGANTVLLNNPSVCTGSVVNCYNSGTVTADKEAGAIAGRSQNRVENCYYPEGQIASADGTVKNCSTFNANNVLEDGRPLYQALNDNIDASSNRKHWAASHELPAVFGDMFQTWTEAGNAAEEGTDYTINGDTYTVFTPLGLAFIANTVNGGDTLQGKTVVLNNDIDLSGVVDNTDLNDNNSWNPIGKTLNDFGGIFDGQNHTVSGMKINRITNSQGLFGLISDSGEVKNLGITNSNITMLRNTDSNTVLNVGILAGFNKGAVRNCYTGENTAISSYTSAGGLVGQNRGIIENSNNAASVTTNQSRAAGICALNVTGTITNCSNAGEVTSNISYASGICGAMLHPDSLIMNCYNTGNVTSGKLYVGGIIGQAASGKVLNCYNTGDVTLTSTSIQNRYAGGICGGCTKAEIINCYNAGNVSAKGGSGGIAGYLSDVTAKIENCYYLSSAAAKLIADNATSYVPTNCSVFGEDGIIVNTNKSLCDALNDGVHTLNNNDAFTWTKGQGFAEFGEPLSEGLTVEAVKLTKAPASSYIQGQTFNPSGMIITLLYSNGSQADVAYSEEKANDFTFTPALDTKLATSDTEIAVEYNGHSVFVPITVSEKNVTGINVSSLPDKTTYLEGQELDLTGMTVTASYDNGDSESIGTYDVTGYDKDKVGNQNVTVSFGGFTASFTVTVKAKTVTGIKILSEPAKKEFVEGSTIDVSGLVVQAQYDNDTTAIVTGYTVNGYDKNTVGKQTVTISYGGFDASFEVEVVAKNMIGISLDTSNVKTSLLESESLDARPLIVTAKYDNGTTESIPVKDCKLSGYNRNQIGVQTVTVAYNGFTAQFDVTVAEKTLIGIKILLAPPKVDYIEGEELDTSGLVVWAQYDNGRGKNVLASVKGYDKNKIGTQLVSVEYGGFTAEYTVTVHPKEITDLSITCLPNKTKYLEGEVLNLNGMIVKASYNNGTTEEVINYVVDEFDNNKIGTQEIEVKYGGKIATFTVEVTQKSLSTINITKKPDRTNYIVGQELSLDGMELTAYYNNGTTEVVDNYTVTGYDKDKIGPQTVTVGYENYTTKLDVTVVDKSVSDIAVMSPPTKTDYIEGQDIELAGLVVTANYDNGTSGNVTGYDIIGYDKNKIGEQVVTVEYAGQTAEFTVNVEAKTLENIMVIRLPFKTEYIEEQELDLTGICVIANYNNGISEEITDYEVSMFDNTKYGMQTIVLTYKDKTATFSLTVAQKQMTKLAITTMPEHITYQKGQELDLTGMTVAAAYDNGKSETVEDYRITGFDKDVTGRQTVVVEYGLMSDSFNIMVAERSLSSITVTPPAKTTYNVGEELDLTGMTVSKVFDNDETEAITEGYTVTGYDKNQTGTQTITVEYEGCKAEFNVTVLNKSEGVARINAGVSFDTAQSIAEITAAPENCEAGVIIAALYKDNALIAIKMVDYNGTDAPNAIGIPYTVQPDTVKVMLWDNLQNMKPICEAETPTESAE